MIYQQLKTVKLNKTKVWQSEQFNSYRFIIRETFEAFINPHYHDVSNGNLKAEISLGEMMGT